jgi:hypothetical protein
MNARGKLQVAGGIVLVFLGIFFLIGFGLDIQDLITDTIFIVFGIILIRGAQQRSKKQPIGAPSSTSSSPLTADKYKTRKKQQSTKKNTTSSP